MNKEIKDFFLKSFKVFACTTVLLGAPMFIGETWKFTEQQINLYFKHCADVEESNRTTFECNFKN
jgi:hypothetical protein